MVNVLLCNELVKFETFEMGLFQHVTTSMLIALN